MAAAVWSMGPLARLVPSNISVPLLDRVAVDPRVMLFSLALALGTTLVHVERPIERGQTCDLGRLQPPVENPDVVDPTIETKLEMVELMDSLGITIADIGLPGAGPRAVEDVKAIADICEEEEVDGIVLGLPLAILFLVLCGSLVRDVLRGRV